MDHATPHAATLLLLGLTSMLVSLGFYALHEHGKIRTTHRVVHGTFLVGLGLIILALGLYAFELAEFAAGWLQS